MRVVKQMGLALVAACAMCALIVSSASAAPTFLVHPPTAKLLASAVGSQVLKTAAGEVVCTGLSLTEGAATALQSTTLQVTVEYEKCKAFGLAATITLVKYLLNANGSVNLLNTVTVSGGGGTCLVTIPSAKNQNLNTVKYDNNANGNVLLLAAVTKITSSGVGTCEYPEESIGQDTGIIEVHADGGVVRWDP
jgi:hypothetical protein